MKTFLTQYADRLAAALIMVMLVGVIFFGVVPLTDAIRDARIANEKERIAQDVLTQRIAQRNHVSKELATIAHTKDIPTLPTEADIIALIEMLEQRADARGLTARFAALSEEQVTALQRKEASAKKAKQAKDVTGQKKETPSLRTQKYFTITLTGPFDAVVDFMRVLENAPVFIFMDNVSIVPQPTVRRSGTGVVLRAPQDAPRVSENTPQHHVVATISAHMPFAQNVTTKRTTQ